MGPLLKMIFNLVVLAGAITNTPCGVKNRSDQQRSVRVPIRSRVTNRQRLEAVELYNLGLSALDVAERLGLGKSTVLKILKTSGVKIRPQGPHLH